MLGDFNTWDITGLLQDRHQSVTCQTRLNKTTDFCHSSIHDAFQSMSRPPLGPSDYNMIQPVPKHRQMLKREQHRPHCVQAWDNNSSEAFKGCFECTNWQVFFNGCLDNPDEWTDTVTSYKQFREWTIVQTKTVSIFPNNKPWITWKVNLMKRKWCFSMELSHLSEFQTNISEAKLNWQKQSTKT